METNTPLTFIGVVAIVIGIIYIASLLMCLLITVRRHRRKSPDEFPTRPNYRIPLPPSYEIEAPKLQTTVERQPQIQSSVRNKDYNAINIALSGNCSKLERLKTVINELTEEYDEKYILTINVSLVP